jgi:AraC-like DNA-binding protein
MPTTVFARKEIRRLSYRFKINGRQKYPHTLKTSAGLIYPIMRIVHRDFAPQYPKMDPRPGKKILSGRWNPDPVISPNLPQRDPKRDLCSSNAQRVYVSLQRESIHRVGQSREFMEQHYNQRIKIPSLAAQANVSVSHFFKIFKEETGYAPLVYLNRLKVERACDWLVTTAWSIKLISANLGYNDPLYFSRVFKSFIGMAPKAYRRSKKNGFERSVS